MPKIRCEKCSGSGQVMGGGMLLKSCDNCDGLGKIIEPEDDIEFLLSKESDHYKNAKKKIKSLDKKISDEEAEKILDEEIGKQNKKGK